MSMIRKSTFASTITLVITKSAAMQVTLKENSWKPNQADIRIDISALLLLKVSVQVNPYNHFQPKYSLSDHTKCMLTTTMLKPSYFRLRQTAGPLLLIIHMFWDRNIRYFFELAKSKILFTRIRSKYWSICKCLPRWRVHTFRRDDFTGKYQQRSITDSQASTLYIMKLASTFLYALKSTI